MFKNTVPLNSEKHHLLCFDTSPPDYKYARDLVSCPVFSGEASRIAREYVLVFPKDEGLPIALLGYQENVNAYIGERPAWLARYVPAHIRRYPFMAAEAGRPNNDETRTMAVLIDEASPLLNYERGRRLFTDEQRPTDFLLEVQKTLKHLYVDEKKTIDFVRQIFDADLLVERHVKVADRSALTGFPAIHGE